MITNTISKCNPQIFLIVAILVTLSQSLFHLSCADILTENAYKNCHLNVILSLKLGPSRFVAKNRYAINYVPWNDKIEKLFATTLGSSFSLSTSFLTHENHPKDKSGHPNVSYQKFTKFQLYAVIFLQDLHLS